MGMDIHTLSAWLLTELRWGEKGADRGGVHEQGESWHSSNGNHNRCTNPSTTVHRFPVMFSIAAFWRKHCHTHTCHRYICQQTFKHYSIIEGVSLNHILSSSKSLCAGIREVNLPVSAVCRHLSVVGLLFSPTSPTKDS